MAALLSVVAMPGMAGLRFSLHTALTRWDLSVFPLAASAALVAAACWYFAAEWRLAARGRSWSTWRTVSFLCGLATVDLAIESPVAVLADGYFQAHVVQHLLLMAVAPPLLALGAPSTLYLQSSDRAAKSRWLRVLRSRPFAVLTHPITAWCAYYGAMFAFFLTGLVNLAMDHMALMDVCNVAFLLGGLLYWWPMVGIDPIIHWRMSHGARLFNILLGGGVEAFLGVAILNDARPVASMYSLASTHSGGALLWVSTELVAVGAFVPIFLQWMRSEDRLANRFDTRAQREAASGRASGPRQASVWEQEWLARTGSVPDTVGVGPLPEQLRSLESDLEQP